MRPKTTVYIATSVDGFIARADGAIDWLEHDAGDDDYGFHAFMASIDAIILGRATYQQVLGFGVWPYKGKRVTVYSRTLGPDDTPEHLRDQVEFSGLPPGELLDQLGRAGVAHVYVDGGKTVQSFLAAGLIDELIISRMPILLGAGIPLFGPLGGDVAH